MAEYIDREALEKAMTVAAVNGKDKDHRTWATAICVLHDIPTADVAPVVRCKDCKYYKISELHPPFKFCFRLRHPTENRSVGYRFADDDFCSYGERRAKKEPPEEGET